MTDDKDIVFFLMPDGTKVSNDPRWLMENMYKAQEAALESTPHTGNVGVTDAEQAAQVGGGVAPGQSGQPGVGESAVATAEQVARGRLGGSLVQVADADAARAAGFTEDDPLLTREVPDSNEAVLAAREAEAKRQATAKKAQDALAEAGEEPGDLNVPYAEWTAKQLKAEITRRNADRDEDSQIVTKGLTKKSEVAALLDEDDEANAPKGDDGN